MNDQMLWWIIAALLGGPVLAGVGYVLLQRMFSGSTGAWGLFLALAGGGYWWWTHH